MAIKQLDPDLWRLDVRIFPDGREYRARENFKGNRKQAEARYYDIRRQLSEKATEEHRSFTSPQRFKELIAYWEKRREWSENTAKKMEYAVSRLKGDLGEVLLSELVDRFDRFLAIIRREKSPKTGETLAPGTVNAYITTAKTICNFAYKFDLIASNPLKRFSKVREIGRDRVLTDGETKKLFQCLDTFAPHLKPAVLFAMLVPIRKGELIALRRENLDMINGVIRLRNGSTKNRQGTFIPIPEPMRDYFLNLPKETDCLFFRKEGEEYFPLGDFKRSWKSVKKRAGIEDFHFHDLRHISASNMIDAGTPERIVRAIANWKTDMLTRYYHISSKRIFENVRFVETGHLTGHLQEASS